MNKCTICLSPFTIKSHTPSLLKCGHIFGYSCIQNYYDRVNTDNKANCPTCKKKFSKSQIIKIYGSLFTNKINLNTAIDAIVNDCLKVKEVGNELVKNFKKIKLRNKNIENKITSKRSIHKNFNFNIEIQKKHNIKELNIKSLINFCENLNLFLFMEIIDKKYLVKGIFFKNKNLEIKTLMKSDFQVKKIDSNSIYSAFIFQNKIIFFDLKTLDFIKEINLEKNIKDCFFLSEKILIIFDDNNLQYFDIINDIKTIEYVIDTGFIYNLKLPDDKNLYFSKNGKNYIHDISLKQNKELNSSILLDVKQLNNKTCTITRNKDLEIKLEILGDIENEFNYKKSRNKILFEVFEFSNNVYFLITEGKEINLYVLKLNEILKVENLCFKENVCFQALCKNGDNIKMFVVTEKEFIILKI